MLSIGSIGSPSPGLIPGVDGRWSMSSLSPVCGRGSSSADFLPLHTQQQLLLLPSFFLRSPARALGAALVVIARGASGHLGFVTVRCPPSGDTVLCLRRAPPRGVSGRVCEHLCMHACVCGCGTKVFIKLLLAMGLCRHGSAALGRGSAALSSLAPLCGWCGGGHSARMPVAGGVTLPLEECVCCFDDECGVDDE
eukprot:GHVU01138346.1.p1 GENE.GHVU01138346.1~~GHVU01138346.1.p1  ORF type:complete len:195 (+),score=15.99 GHVU01138346.1:536-1120(+)